MTFWCFVSMLPVLLVQATVKRTADGCLVWQQFANCSSLKLTYLPLDLMIPIYELDASYNEIKLIQWPLPYFHLINLNLSHNSISQVGYHAFLHLFSLNTLDLSYNNIKYLSHLDSNFTFLNTPQLTSLILRGNPLKAAGSDPIRSESLRKLDVSDCGIRNLEGETSLLLMPNLITLNIEKNPLSKIDVLVSESLEVLIMSETHLRYIKPEFYMGAPKLKYLDLSKNTYLTSLCRTGTAISPNLKVLKAEFCSLEYLRIKGFPNIEELYLKGNRIDRIAVGDLTANERLVVIDLSMNWIYQIDPMGFKGGINVASLDLSGNKILELQNSLSTLPGLVYLNISNNPLFSIDGIETVFHLSVLDASHCDLSSVPDQLFELENLETVNLSRNAIDYLPSGMSSFTLIELNLANNRLTEVRDSWFKHFPRLKILRLEGNRLTEPFHRDTITRLKHVDLGLGDNPWRCNCAEQRFRNFYGHLSNKGDPSALVCHGPINVTGMTWKDACFTEEAEANIKRVKKNAWLPMLLAALATVGIVVLLYLLRKKTGNRTPSQDDRNAERYNSNSEHRSSSRSEAHLPSYEEAILMPKPKITTKANADTQTQASFLGSIRSLDAKAKHPLIHSPSSNSL